jgi:endonuclease III
MTAASRSTRFAKVHKILKKHYKAVPLGAGRTVMEHLLCDCCLEGAHHEAAEEAFAALVHTFFDWNEVRVTSISELSEVMACLPDPRAAANRIKRVLHSVFEATFSFDLEERKKSNLGPTVEWLEKLDGTGPFTVAYAVQMGLGGHAIPIDAGTMAALRVLDLVTDKDVEAGVVPGLERAVAKSKGIEFGTLLHEFGADFAANPYSSKMREVLLQIDPSCESRLPKRRVDRAPEKPLAGTKQEAPPAKEAESHLSAAGKKAAEKKESKAPAPSGKAAARKKQPSADGEPTLPVAEPPKKKSVATAESGPKHSVEKPRGRPPGVKKTSATEGLAKRKPR